MKKIFLVIISIFFSFSAFAQLSNAYNSTKNTIVEIMPSSQPQNCPVYSDTPVGEIVRPDFELDFRVGILDSPAGGSYAFTIENFDLLLRHNLSSTLFVYGWIGVRDYEKFKAEGSEYEESWKSKAAFGGIGVYLMPTIGVFAGGGNIWLEDSDGNKPELDIAVERGISIDIPVWNNKLVVAYRFIDAKLKDQQDINISEIQGDGSYSVVSIAFSTPFSFSK